MQYFDVEAKTWKPLASTTPSIEASYCCCAASAGNNLYVAGNAPGGGYYIYRFDTEGNLWEKLPHKCDKISNLCSVGDYVYAVSTDCNQFHERYSFAKCQWQTFAKVSIPIGQKFFCSGAAVLGSKLYVLYGRVLISDLSVQNAVLYCFDPVKNEWEEKATTCSRHYRSSLFVVDNRIYVAGGYDSSDICGNFRGNQASVEAYDGDKNAWCDVEQKHIPPGNPNAVEIEGKIYFIINTFPVDSGIRIPPGELYPVPLGEWEKLGQFDRTAVLCYMPVKRESLKLE